MSGLPVDSIVDTAPLPEFRTALLDAEHPVPEGIVGPDGLAAPKRFNVYRNNVIVSLTEALGQTFPAIETLLGQDYFKALARTFVVSHPPASPVLIWYGGEFAAFLEAFEPLADYRYLADVARVEWFWLQSYHAEDAHPLDPAQLAALQPDQVAETRFHMHPATAWVSSSWPVFDLAAANRFAADQEISVDLSQAQSILITRPAFDVELMLMRPGSDLFLNSLATGASLGDAAAEAISGVPDFDLSASLTDFLSAGVFTGLR